MRYKNLFAASAIALMAFPALAQENVTWWDFLSGGDGVRMKALISRFNEEHPDIKVTGTTLEWGIPFYTKVRTARRRQSGTRRDDLSPVAHASWS
jgi:multiple sugar transport system substrate-binding protein